MQSKLGNLLKSYPLLKEEIGVIEGCLLGDGSLGSSGKHYRLRIEHKIAHSEYVWWKYTLLKRITVSQPQKIPSHNSIRFGTIGHPQITLLRNKWYGKNNTKKLPKNFELTNLSIAIWFMDDGCKHRDTVDISVHNFQLTDIKKLQKMLNVYNISSTINNDSKGYRIYIKKQSYPAFKKLVKPYIIKCMAYKLP